MKSLQRLLIEAEGHAAKFARAAELATDPAMRNHALRYARSWQREAERNRAAISRRG